MKIYEIKNISTIIALFAVVLALIFSLIIFPIIQQPLNLNIDPDKNGDLSKNIFAGNGYIYSDVDKPTVDRGPVYPYMIALLFTVTGTTDYRVVQIFQAILFAATGLLVFFIVKYVSSSRTAVYAQIFYTLHPMFIWYTSRVWIETTHTFLITLTAYILIRVYHKLSLPGTIILGIILGLTILTKSILIVFPILLLFLFYFKWRKRGIIFGLVTLITAYLIILPWTYRNYIVSNEIVPVHTSLGLNLIQGDALANNWLKDPLSNMSSWYIGDVKMTHILKGTSASPQDAVGDKILVVNFIDENLKKPHYLLWRTLINSITFWYLSESPVKSIFLALIQFPLLILFIFGLKRIWKELSTVIPLIWMILYFSVVHSFIIGWARYSVPIVPLILSVVVIYFFDYTKIFRSKSVI
ncbi:MAG: glycosyltransferase family 39 protein [Bacteroidota bacterium]|nr:glycosyltransferase family 39 protein [Bacteroidota bacterium]